MRLLFALLAACCCFAYGTEAPGDFVVEHFSKEVRFHNDGSWQAEQAATVRIESAIGIRQYGTLSFTYTSGAQSVNIDFVRVRKAGGSVVVTPASDAQDAAAAVDAEAPAYAGERELRVPVRGLGVGDVLEYRVHFVQAVAEIAGEFWYSHRFLRSQAVLDQTLTIRVPSGRHVQLRNEAGEPQVQQDGTERVYRWSRTRGIGGSVALTTFRSWAQLGAWYATAFGQAASVTPAVQAKADEITRGLTTSEDKQKALYQYVATQFRYVALALGAGRYQPHTAEQVLRNGYGDCKDKHTLLAALLKAEGIEASPALVSLQANATADLPTPDRFDHVITVLGSNEKRVWLDTTAEVAPYGWLTSGLRGGQALCLPHAAAAELVTIPAELPFKAQQEVVSEGVVSEEGVLKTHVTLSVRGDDEVTIRTAFHRAPAEQWPQLTQGLASNMGLDGAISHVQAGTPEELGAAYSVAFDYERKSVAEGPKLLVPQSSFPFVFALDETDAKPSAAVRVAAEGEMVHRFVLQLPPGFAAVLPDARRLDAPFASYQATYSQKDQTLTMEQHVRVKRGWIQPEEWEQYVAFLQEVKQGQSEYTQLTNARGQEAGALIQAANEAIQDRELDLAEDELEQARRLDAGSAELWIAYARLLAARGAWKQAVEAQEKALTRQPEDVVQQLALADLLLKAGEKTRALALLGEITKKSSSAAVLNNAAYLLAQVGVAPGEALRYARESLRMLQSKMANVTLDKMSARDLRDVEVLASVWDTLGWTLYQAGKPSEARAYLEAAWSLAHSRAAAEHLHTLQTKQPEQTQETSQDALKRRTLDASEIAGSGSAEYFLLFVNGKAVDARFIDGAPCLQSAKPVLIRQTYGAAAPDAGPERIVRRALLDCSADRCQLTLLLPAAAVR